MSEREQDMATGSDEGWGGLNKVGRGRRPGSDLIYKKEDLVFRLGAVLRAVMDTDISDAQVWTIFKACLFQACSFGEDKPLSLSGIGKFSVVDSKVARRRGQPPLRVKSGDV